MAIPPDRQVRRELQPGGSVRRRRAPDLGIAGAEVPSSQIVGWLSNLGWTWVIRD
jgi:hypothetical protein